MNEIGPINQNSPAIPRINTRHASDPTAASSVQRGSDTVEVSHTAQLLAKLADLPDVREDVIARIRSEIESGEYETPEKLEAAIDALIEDL